jgi:undecaprenyl-diphosphatase
MPANDAKTPEISIAVPTHAVTPHEPSRERAVRRLWRAETIYALSLLGFSVLALLAHFVTYFDWDLRVERAIQSLPVPGLFGMMRAVSIFGNGWIPWALTIITVAIFYAYRKRSEAMGLLLSAGGGSLLNIMVKMLVGRPRPTAELVSVYRDLRTESFPSGHVTFYVCYFGFLFFAAFALLPRGSWARRTALFLTALPVALVGLSRVYLGAHWPSDTLGAYLLSGLWLALSLHLYRRWKQRATFHPELQKPDAALEG